MAIGARLDAMTGADGGADPGARPRWRWDAALSFAGAGHARCRIGARCGHPDRYLPVAP